MTNFIIDKKIWILTIILGLSIIVILLFIFKDAGTGVPVNLKNFDKVNYINVQNGTTGEFITIRNTDEIHAVLSAINDLELKTKTKLPQSAGWSVALILYYDDDIFDRYTLRPDGIQYGEYLYSNGKDLTYFMNYYLSMFQSSGE